MYFVGQVKCPLYMIPTTHTPFIGKATTVWIMKFLESLSSRSRDP